MREERRNDIKNPWIKEWKDIESNAWSYKVREKDLNDV